MTNEHDMSKANQSLRIALGVPEWKPFRHAMENKPVDATYVIQSRLARRLKDRGHRLTYIAPNTLEELIATEVFEQDISARRTWTSRPTFNILSKFVWRLQKLLGIPYFNFFSNIRYMDACLQVLPGHDIVYERNGMYTAGLAMASRRLNLPYVIFFEADQLMEFDIMGKPITGLLRWRAEQLLRYNLKAADCIICVSQEGREHLEAEWQVPPQKIVVFPNAVDVDKFKPDANAGAAIRSTLKIEANPVIMFLGNFFAWHDVTTLLYAFAVALKSHPAARLILVGDGEYRPTMELRAAELGLSYAVTFTGMVPPAEAPNYVAAADVAVVPYPPMRQKMWLSPLKLFEYMASGKAVVASAIGQVNQVICDRKNGMLVPPGNSTALASALDTLLRDKNLRDALGKQARSDAVTKYSWDNYVARLERLMRLVITRQPFDSI